MLIGYTIVRIAAQQHVQQVELVILQLIYKNIVFLLARSTRAPVFQIRHFQVVQLGHVAMQLN